MRFSDDGGSSGRPTNWWILGLSSDPTPGDPLAAVVLSGQMSGVANGAYESRRGVLSLMGDPAITGWQGASGDAFRGACAPFPDQLATMYQSYQDVADALTAFNTAASSAQGIADSAYYSAHYAAQEVGLSDEDFHSVVGFESVGYFSAVKKVLLVKQRAAEPPTSAPAPAPAQPLVPGVPIPITHDILNPGPDQVHGPYQVALDAMVQAQASALSAKDAYDLAVTRCVNALEEACDVSLRAAAWSGVNGGTFDQRYTTFGGDPSQLHFDGRLFDAAEAAVDAAAWQKAKLNPNDPTNQKIIKNIESVLADHLNDPDYLTAFANASPADVAAFQGLPAVDANALNMAKLRYEVLQPECPPELKKLYGHLADPNDPLNTNNMFLLGFDTRGTGHLVVSYGNPDTAANTAVYVPGTASTLHGMDGDLSRTRALYSKGQGQMASVYWLGYGAPDWPWPSGTATDGGPANQQYADHGGQLLADFVNSLNAQHQGTQNLTLLGHSYGTTVVGDALAHYGAQAQGAIFVGSPGVTANTAADLHLDPSHVWASKMKFDPVPSAAPPLNWDSRAMTAATGAAPYLNWDDDHTLRFANDPTSSSFGGRTFNSDDGSDVLHAHSNYWNEKGPALGNMANIVTGHTDSVQPMSQDAKNGALNFANSWSFGGTVLQNSGHAGGEWGAPIEHLGDSMQSFGAIQGTPAGVAGDLLNGDFSGAGHQITDVPREGWNSLKGLGKSVGDFFSW